MPVTRLSDIIDPIVFSDLGSVNDPSLSAFWQSGVVAESPLFNELAAGSGSTAEMPFWKDLARDEEANISNDDPADLAEPEKVIQGEQGTRKHFLNQGWAAMNLAREIAMTDPIQHVRNRVDAYFTNQWQRRLIASALGVLADNVANDDGDMVYDIAAEATGDQSAETFFSEDAFIGAAFTMGDKVDGVSAIAVHSKVAMKFAGKGGAEDVRDSDGTLLYRTYMGRRIIVDDNMPAIAAGVSGFKYVSVLFGSEAFGYGMAEPLDAVEVERAPRAGNGGGMEELWVRRTGIIHPYGYALTAPPGGGRLTHTEAELKSAATWDRVVDRKSTPLSFLISN